MVLEVANWGGIVAQGLPIGGGLVAGQVGTGAVGTVAVVAEGRSIESGVVATSALGTVLAGAGAIVTETGMVGSIGLGDESVVGTALVTPSGVSSTVSISGYSATTIAKTVTVQSVRSERTNTLLMVCSNKHKSCMSGTLTGLISQTLLIQAILSDFPLRPMDHTAEARSTPLE